MADIVFILLVNIIMLYLKKLLLLLCMNRKGYAIMTEREMFEISFKRPKNYFKLSEKEQWRIDSNLGILDWKGEGLNTEDKKRFHNHYNT